MIQEFSVENYRSIKDRQTFSFLANNKITNANDQYLVVKKNGVSLLKLCILCGPNASGKTNMLKAIYALRNMVLNGPTSKDKPTEYDPFLLSSETRNKPTVFSIVFFIEDIKYSYEISFNRMAVLSESLFFSPEGRQALLYKRTHNMVEQVAKLVIGAGSGLSGSDKKVLSGNTLANISVLRAYLQSNINSKELDRVIAFFRSSMQNPIGSTTGLERFVRKTIDSIDKDFMVSLLNKADFQILDYEHVVEDIPVTGELIKKIKENSRDIPNDVIKEMIEKKTSLKFDKLTFQHQSADFESVSIDFGEESQGTRRYLGLGAVLSTILKSGHFLGIDEIESSLHHELVEFYLKMFLLNSTESQLFVTTQDLDLMDLDYMRHDMVGFCEKEQDGSSNYYKAEDFKIHKNHKLSNLYRVGKLGAVPELGSPMISNEE